MEIKHHSPVIKSDAVDIAKDRRQKTKQVKAQRDGPKVTDSRRLRSTGQIREGVGPGSTKNKNTAGSKTASNKQKGRSVDITA